VKSDVYLIYTHQLMHLYISLFEVIDICDRYQHCNFGEAQAESSLMMVYVNRNMLEQLLQF